MKNKNSSDLSQLAASKQTAAKTLYAAFEALKDASGELPRKELLERMEKKLSFSSWEKEIYKSNGQLRWLTIFQFYTIDAIKSGFLRKEKGTWYLTKEGEAAMKGGELALLEKVIEGYKNWASVNKKDEPEVTAGVTDEIVEAGLEQTQQVNLELLKDQALSGIQEFISKKTPYEFQDMVAALLRAMGYYTTYVASKGKDGGIDIIAYQDPLGSNPPRIKVQVKHKPDSPIPVRDIRSLAGILSKSGDVGLFVSSGIFSPDSKSEARSSHTHIELIDGTRFINLWIEFFSKMPDEDKSLLPLHPINFLGSKEL